MLSSKVTVCFFAWNEERRIREAVADVAGAFPILVVDNASTDRTREVCAEAGIEVVTIANPGFIECDEVMLPLQAHVRTDYLLIASLSEVMPFALLQRYARIAEEGSHDIVRARRISLTNGVAIPLTGSPRQHPGELRFFRKGSVIYTGNKVHERGIPAAGARDLLLPEDPELCIRHFRDYDASKTEDAHRRYDDLLARQRFDQGQRFSLIAAVAWSLGKFCNAYLRYGCWRFGMLGFMHSVYRGWMEFTVWLRIWEWQTGNDLARVRERNDAERARIRAGLREKLGTIGRDPAQETV